MDNIKHEIRNDVCNVVLSWLSLSIPVVIPIKDAVSTTVSLADKLLSNKLYNVLINQDSDFDEWLKISEKFNEDSRSYQKMVKQLIYYISAINEVDMLEAYSSLLRAYKANLICKKDFFRLSFCLTKLLSEDAQYLSDNIDKDKIEENIFCLSLAANNLMYNSTRGLSYVEGEENKEYYCFTQMGKMLDKYALNYGNEEKYSYKRIDSELSLQKLEYSYLKKYKGEVVQP